MPQIFLLFSFATGDLPHILFFLIREHQKTQSGFLEMPMNFCKTQVLQLMSGKDIITTGGNYG